MMQLLVREGYGVNVVLITIDRGPPIHTSLLRSPAKP